MEINIYMLVVLILTISTIGKYQNVNFMNPDRTNTSNLTLGIVVAVFMIWLIGLMPFTGYYTADRGNFVSWYVLFVGKDVSFDWSTKNFFFEYAYELVASKNLPPYYLFFPVSAIYFSCMFLACNKFFPKDGFMAFVVYLGALSTFSYGTNGAKAGAASTLLLMAMAFRNKKIIAALFCFLAYGFHHSMIVPIVMFVITYFIKQRNYYLYFWLASIVIAAFGITAVQEFLINYTNDKGATYLDMTNDDRMVSGFRPDFILYSAVPIYLGYYFHKHFEIESETYDFLLNLYTGTNSLFILCSFGSFINRIAYLSWLMYPIVLIYPFLNCNLGYNQNVYLKNVVYCHFGFTLFMNFVYLYIQ